MDGKPATEYFMNFAFDNVGACYRYVVKQNRANDIFDEIQNPSFGDQLLEVLIFLSDHFGADVFSKAVDSSMHSKDIAKDPKSSPVPSVKFSGKEKIFTFTFTFIGICSTFVI